MKTLHCILKKVKCTSFKNCCTIFSLVLCLLLSDTIHGEGTKEIRPSVGDYGYIILDPAWSAFGLYGCPATSRIHIRICNVGEKIYYGFNQPQGDVKYRIKAPDGSIVVSQSNVPTTGAGYISTYAKAYNGPDPIVGTSGYTPLSFIPADTGNYYIEFQLPNGNPRREFNYFDITVASAANVAIPGRVWCQSWMFSTGNYGRPYRGSAYIYADDGIVTSIDFNGMDPYVFVLNANQTGTGNTGNAALDRQSKPGVATYPKYKVFLNNPDESCYPTGSFGQITAPTTISGCPPTNFCLNVFVNRPGRAEVLLDLNGTPGYQAGTKDRIISQEITPPSGCIPWDGKDGLGNKVTTAVQISTQVDFYNGLTHIPLYDVERNPNGYKVALVRPAGPTPKLFYDDTKIVASGGASNLNGCTSPCHTWDWTCCSNNAATDYGNTNTINTWWYADSTKYTTNNAVPPGILVDAEIRNNSGASNDTTICGNLSAYTLSASVQNATGGQWATSGTGTFSPSNTALTGTYNISAADRTSGKVTLRLTSVGNGACPAISDSLIIRFQAPPSVNAGSDKPSCANNPSVNLTGSVSNVGGGLWSTSGTGTFSPAATSLNAVYTPSAADITAKAVTLTLTTTGNGTCPAMSDQMTITIQDAPTANAGSPVTVCQTNPAVSLAGTVTNAAAQTWSGGAGTFAPSASSLNATYTPTASEIAAGVMNLTLTATRPGCTPVPSNVTVNFSPGPTVDAGANQMVCSNSANVNLSGSGTNAVTYTWSGGTGNFTPNNTTLNAIYTPTATEKTSGPVTLTLTAAAPGCAIVSDQMTITFVPGPTSNAGPDATVCANNAAHTLSGAVTGASGAIWSGGSGNFTPNANTLNAVYTPTASEISTGLIALVLTTTGNSNGCNAVSDTIVINVTPAQTANAGTDKTVCENNAAVTLGGSVTLASSFSWSGGTGTFTPNNTTLNAQYTPSATEITAGSITLTLTSLRTKCNPVSDQMTISLTPKPTANAGADQSVCFNNATISLSGAVTVASGGTWSGGSGTFTPNANTLNATYTPTLAEKNSGSLTLTLTSTGNGTCNAVSDQMTVTFTPAPVVDAGNNQTVCGNNALVNLSGSVTVATGVTWSGGTGTFSPGPSALAPSYAPSVTEIAAGTVILTLTSANNGNCNPVTDQVTITISPAPTISGTDKTICADNPVASLSASETVATGVIWSGGAGTFTPDNTSKNVTYTPTVSEISAGTVNLTATTTGNGNCNAVSDPVTVSIAPAPSVSAGPDQTICASATKVNLNGTVTAAGGVKWTASGTGSFSPNATTLNAKYNPTAADKTAGTVTLTITTTGNGSCNAISDQMVVTFTEIPTINAGPDQIVCTNSFPVQLHGSGSAAQWTGGNGTFNPDATTLNAAYTPSATEVTSGSVTLTLTTIPSGACSSVSDKVIITLPPAPAANAGADQTMCGNASAFTLNGTVSNATGGFWTTSGTGSFTPNANALNAAYHPSVSDVSSGNVTLSLTTIGNGPCVAHSDNMVLTIQPAVDLDAGPDQTLCADKNGIALSGSVSNSTGAVWSTSGSGQFIPDASALNASYNPSASDKSAGSVTLTLTSNASGVCPAITDNVVFTITPAPTVNAGADQAICGDASAISLSGNVTVATGGSWTSSGTGTFTPDPVSAVTSYIPSVADKAAGSVTFTMTTTGNGTCSAVSDQLTVSIAPVPSIEAGADRTVCADAGAVNLNGSVTVATGGTWSTSGNGTFSNANTLNSSYTLGSSDIAAGTVTLTLTSTGNGICSAVNDRVVITITPAPTVNAGTDRNICANNASVNLNGIVTVATGGAWSGGNGTFIPGNTDLHATYAPSDDEITAGTVTLTLTTTGNGICQAKTDNVTIAITPAPTISAGSDQAICADSMGLPMNGSVTIAGGGLWTSTGTGNFYPNNTVKNATYVPSASDRSLGNVTLTFTSTGNGNCNAVSDEMLLSITPAPTVNAGVNQIVCANNADVTLNGSVSIASGGIWSTLGSGTFANSASLSTIYSPSATDKAAGSVTLTLTTSGNGTCKPVSNAITVTITPAPVVNAGADLSSCGNNPNVKLNGSFTVASGITWTTSGNGQFTPDANTTNATYTPSPSDIASGNIILTLTTTGNGLCNAVTDQMTVNIAPTPVVNAGTDQTVCADVSGLVQLNGAVQNASGGIWTSSGTGIFSPSTSALNAVYTPSPADTAAHTVTLTLSSTGNGLCNAVSDQMIVTIVPAPIVNAGADQTVCGDIEFLSLAGTVTHAAGGSWSSSGSGLFSPDGSTLNSNYFFSSSELAGGAITLTLISTGNGTCLPVSDQKIVTITPVPSVNAGPDQTVCANNANITLKGSAVNTAGVVWTSTGDGTFANAAALNTSYTPSAADLSAGTVILTLQTNGTGACNPASDQTVITITPAPIANAGADQSVCANNNIVTLNGTVQTASGATWTSSGTGSFSPSINSLNAAYAPSAADITAGNVTLSLTTTGNGNCNAVTDQMTVTITPAPTVNPGTVPAACANTSGISLNGLITVAGGGTWSTASGTGTFLPDANALNATFIPSSLHIANGRANLTLTTTGNGNCAPVSATIVITIQPVPAVNAGPDVKVCTGTGSINLNGTVTNAGGGTWSTSGNGTFMPNANALNATYVPSAAENTDGNTVTLTLSTTGNGACAVVNDQLTITFQTIPVNAGPNQTICSNSLPVQLNGSGNGTWSGGAGTFSDPNSLSTSYTPAASEIPGTVTLTLTGNAVGACVPGTDVVTITIIDGPVANAGADQSICANNPVVTLNGSIAHATGGSWDSEGSGSFDNTNALTSTYTASAADIASGSIKLTLTSTGNGICNAASDTMLVSFTPAPVVNAGTDIAACANAGPVNINGSVTVAPGATWSIVSGNGSIGNINNLSTTYTPAATDVTSGSVTLRLTSNPAGNCNQVSDDIVISFGQAPSANAGNDQTICADASSVNLSGAVTIAGGGQWSTTGTGAFTPNANALNASYIPSAADTTAKTVTLTLTTTGNGNCMAESDQMVITITPVPTVNAGADQTLCADIASVSINGNVTIAAGGKWTSSGSGSFANSNSVATAYIPSASDKASGSVILTLTTTGNGTCHSYSDQLTIFLSPAPKANAGLDQSVCKDVNNVSLHGTVTNASGGTWTSSGSGTFADANDLNTSYSPSAGDKTTGSVTLTLTTAGTGICNAVNDQMVITFTPTPTANAGNDRNTCADKDTIGLHGKFTISSGIVWTTSGSGTFSPNASNPDAIYYMSGADKAAGNVTITLTTVDNGTCNAVNDQMAVNIAPKPIVNAGADLVICAGQSNATLNASITNAGGGIWTTSGTGSISNTTSLNTTYIPSASDILNGGALITLTSTSNGTCNAVSDVIVVNVISSPSAEINAGLDQTLCSDVDKIKLNGFVSNAGGGHWTSPGTGSFSPDANTLDAVYLPSPADVAGGSIIITLTTTNNGSCSAVSDNMKVDFTPAPTANAGADQTICGVADALVNLTGTVTVATGGQWSGGSGVFTPDPVTLKPVYYPSDTDKSLGKVTITLTTTGNGTCKPVSDQMIINITKPPVVNAGNDITICSDAASFALNGKVANATGGQWTTSGTGSFTNANILNATYKPSDADTTNKVITFTLTSVGGCVVVSDQLTLSFKSKPEVNAGPTQKVCASTASVLLNGTTTNTKDVAWSTSGSGNFSNPNGNNTSYFFSQSDRDAEGVTLKLTSLNNGVCTAVSDTIKIVIQPQPQVSFSTPRLCDPKKGVSLIASVSSATGGIWASSGTGAFSPDVVSLSTNYHPSKGDLNSQNVTLTFTTTGNGVCDATSYSDKLVFGAAPVSNAGKDLDVCPGSTITLSARTSPNVTYQWASTNGTVISHNPTANVTIQSDTMYVLTVTDRSGCAKQDSVNVKTFQLPVFNMDPAYCLSNSLILNSDPVPVPAVPGTFQWYRNGKISEGANATVLSPIEGGNYMIVFSFGNCMASGSTTVNEPPRLLGAFVTDCENKNTSVSVKSNVTGVSYVWSTGDSGTDLTTINVTVKPDTSYYVATVTDNKGCASKDSVRVIGIPVPALDLEDKSACEGNTITLEGKPTNINDPDTYFPVFAWYKNNDKLPQAASSTLDVTTTGQYKLEISIGRCAAKDSANITFNPNPVTALPETVTFCRDKDNHVTLDAGTGKDYKYQWTAPAGIALDSVNARMVTAYRKGVYKVTITNSFNCTLTDSILVKDICPPKVHVPNAILPDAPGPDQTFKVFGEYFTNYKLQVFNRWGEVIFISFDRNEGWDGTYRGNPMPVGVYPWVITYEGEDPNNRGPFREEGSVTIVR